MVFVREENNEGLIEDDQGNIVAKLRKSSLRGWWGKIFQENGGSEKSPSCSPSSSAGNDSPNEWEKYVEEVDTYFNQLLASNADEEDGEMASDILYSSLTEQDMAQNMVISKNFVSYC